jgi:hypothetical protein
VKSMAMMLKCCYNTVHPNDRGGSTMASKSVMFL